MIGIIDFLAASGVAVSTESLKIHLAGWNGYEHPIDVFLEGRFEEWQANQNKKNFECAQVLSLINLGYGRWLFAGLFAVDCHEPHPTYKGNYRYNLQPLPEQDDLIGRIVIHYERKSRVIYGWYNAEKYPFPIAEILREKVSVGDFPGYSEVRISFARLRIIVGQKHPSWHGALANTQGVYLITDTSTGKHYVGKASGNEGLWQRWCNYANDGHGGNKELRELIQEHGIDYAQNFQYAILEVLLPSATEDEVQRRERHWMNVLRSCEFGLNWHSKNKNQEG